ncbi:MAG TPA: NAD(P)H-dependent oxidoreductase [Rhabdochlamydiaceae bacterium]|jgi:FMN-dependent NADH-azoreductase
MNKLLHIIATPREDESRTLQISEAFLKTFTPLHPDWVVEDLNLTKEPLPPLTMKRVDGKYLILEGKELFGDLREGWREIIAHINRFLSASAYLISCPMWNFSIPYMLKQYIDIIVQPNFLFKYTKTGSEGLVLNRKMVVIASYGGNYLSEQNSAQNFHEPYLRMIFGFVGITDIQFIVAQPTDMGSEREKKTVQQAIEAAKQLASNKNLFAKTLEKAG